MRIPLFGLSIFVKLGSNQLVQFSNFFPFISHSETSSGVHAMLTKNL